MSLIKEKRLQARKTQEEISSLLEIKSSVYQRIENDPDYASPKILMKLCRILGFTMEELFSDTPEFTREKLDAVYQQQFSKVAYLSSCLEDYSTPVPESKRVFDSAIARLKTGCIKPNLGVMGRSDAGKSHLINTLIGHSTLPASLQPTTNAVTILIHKDDQPDWVNSNVIVFNEFIPLEKLTNESYCRSDGRIRREGDIDILSNEIAHKYNDDKVESEGLPYSCVIYLDSDMLNACNIIDSPGFANTDHGEKDREKAFSILSILDVLVYMSPATGCIDHTDMASLRSVFKTLYLPENFNLNLPPLSNLFFVTSQAHDQISDNDLALVKDTASRRIFDFFEIGDGSGVLEERSKQSNTPITCETLKSRWYNFWSSNSERCSPFIEDLITYLGIEMPNTFKICTEKLIFDVKNEGTKDIKTLLATAENNLVQYDLFIESCKNALDPLEITQQTERIEKTKAELLAQVSESNSLVASECDQAINAFLSAQNIEKLIKLKFNNKKDAQQYAAGMALERVQTKVEHILLNSTSSIEESINEKLDAFSLSMNKISKNDIPVGIPFDGKGVFTGTAIGAGLAAGLGAYASTMGALGGYAVASQAVGILSSLGVGFGWSSGTAGIMSGMATIGGPVVLTLVIAAGVAILGKRLFGDTWQTRLSKQIIKTIEENGVTKEILSNVDQQFEGMTVAIENGCENLKVGYKQYLVNMQKAVEDPVTSKRDLIARMEQFREGLSFFVAAPWALA